MALVDFVARIHVFEKHAILDISENLKLVKQMKMLINERIALYGYKSKTS
jgi:hypothetical protein